MAEALAAGTVSFGGRVTVPVGNPSRRRGTRLCEADLNRVFVDTDLETIEHRRRRLRRILDSADLFIDFHQTNGQTPSAFYIFRGHPVESLGAGARWAPRWVTRRQASRFLRYLQPTNMYATGEGGAHRRLQADRVPRLRNHPPDDEPCPVADRLADSGAARSVDGPSSHRCPSVSPRFCAGFADPRYAMRRTDNLRRCGPVVVSMGDTLVVCPIDGWVMMASVRTDARGACLPPVPGAIYRVLQEFSPTSRRSCSPRRWPREAEPLDDGAVIVTGASSGIADMVRQLANRARVLVVVARRRARLSRPKASPGQGLESTFRPSISW